MISDVPFRARLESGAPIVADGAMGTMLHARGVDLASCLDALNQTRPSLVTEIHAAYLAAGAELIETNTFGANRYKLSSHGLGDQVAALNRRGVELARLAVERGAAPAFIAGSVGPLGVRLAPYGRVTPDQAFAAFHEQIAALAAAGAQAILIETMSDVREAEQAVRAARNATDLPVLVSLTFTRDDRTLLGDAPGEAAATLQALGVDAIGANCSGGPAQLLRIVDRMRNAAPAAILSVMPNAGWPEQVSGRIAYPATPAYLAEHARAYRAAGARVIGGCCGTTPEHIAAVRRALDAPAPATPSAVVVLDSPTAQDAAALPDRPTRLSDRLQRRDFVVAVEMDPPRGLSTHRLMAGASLLAEAGADTINVADSPMARMRMSPWAVCHQLQHELGVETVLHFPTRGRSLLRIQGDLLAAHALGVRNVFVVLGDPTAIGDYPEAMDDFDVVPSGLIRLIKSGFNSGVDHAGADLGGPTSFTVGCALNLTPPDPQRELRALRRKVQAGADFALTQPVFDPPAAQAFLDRYESEYGPLELPVLAGLLPLINERHADYLHNEVPGVRIPESHRRRIAAAGEAGPAEGLRLAREIVAALRPSVQGIYLMPPFSRYDLAAELVEAVRREPLSAGPARRGS